VLKVYTVTVTGDGVAPQTVTITQAAAEMTDLADGAGGWLESPALTGNEDFVGTLYAGSKRNYSYSYDYTRYTQMWAAYPLYADAMGSLSRDNVWSYNPQISQAGDGQVNITGSTSYGVSYGSGTNYYARGHMVPNASRNGDKTMQDQTFYVTNSVPQVQNHFNSGMWSSLESAMQTIAKQTDTLYLVTGVAFRKQGGSEAIKYITPQADPDKQVPVPNYFYKVALKVKREGGKVTSASSVGVWLENKEYDESNYRDYTVSVDQIEQWTGMNFFVNLPDALESLAETNSDWTVFTDF
jgi:endonuclease G